MTINFTQIPDKLKYPYRIRARLSTLHSSVITYVSEHPDSCQGHSAHRNIIAVMNTLSYLLISDESLPANWSDSDPLNNLSLIDDDKCRYALGSDLYILEKNIRWDDIQQSSSSTYRKIDNPRSIVTDSSKPVKISESGHSPALHLSESRRTQDPTPKEDLYIRPPIVPQFDTAKPWKAGICNGEQYIIYSSIPEIPTKQNEISATTDVSKFTSTELLNLYPNRFVRTRAACMYERVSGLEYDNDLGVIIPVNGFTSDQIKDNIIKYPHIFKLTRIVDNSIVSLYTTIEIDGQLLNVSDVWNSLPESDYIPRTSEFVKEYVVRRYLLERDICNVDHKYPLYGSLDPFLTLFMTPEDYSRFGYSDTLGLAKQCVLSRVRYKQTRNPILRRLGNA